MSEEYEEITIEVGGVKKLIISCHPYDVQKIIDGITRYISRNIELIPANLSGKDIPVDPHYNKDTVKEMIKTGRKLD